MSYYLVRTIEIEPSVGGVSEYFNEVPASENVVNKFGNRFPFNDLERNKLEVYEYGNKAVCEDFLRNKIPTEIQEYFTIEEYIED